MKTMAAGFFKAKRLAVMDEVQATQETVVITKRGKPLAKLVPVNVETDEIYDFMAGKRAVTADVVSPAISAVEWDELK
jgi:prevent-host-death family protein